jgi:hypothetical protein
MVKIGKIILCMSCKSSGEYEPRSWDLMLVQGVEPSCFRYGWRLTSRLIIISLNHRCLSWPLCNGLRLDPPLLLKIGKPMYKVVHVSESASTHGGLHEPNALIGVVWSPRAVRAHSPLPDADDHGADGTSAHIDLGIVWLDRIWPGTQPNRTEKIQAGQKTGEVKMSVRLCQT